MRWRQRQRQREGQWHGLQRGGLRELYRLSLSLSECKSLLARCWKALGRRPCLWSRLKSTQRGVGLRFKVSPAIQIYWCVGSPADVAQAPGLCCRLLLSWPDAAADR